MTTYLVGDSWAAMNEHQNFGAIIVAKGGSSSQYWSDYLDKFIEAGGKVDIKDIIILNFGGVDFLNHIDRQTTYTNLKHIAQILSDQGAYVEIVGVPNVNSLSDIIGHLTIDPLFNRIKSEVRNIAISTAMIDTIQDPSNLDSSGFHLNYNGYEKYNQILKNDFYENFVFNGINKDKLQPIVYDNHNMILDNQHHKVIVSDEPYWNADSNTNISQYVPVAHQYDLQAGVAITPKSWDEYGGLATTQQLIDLVTNSDFIMIDPYVGTGLSVQQLLDFSKTAVDYVHSVGKEIYLAQATYSNPNLVQETIQFNNTVVTQNHFDGVYYVSAADFPEIPANWELNLVGVVPGMF